MATDLKIFLAFLLLFVALVVYAAKKWGYSYSNVCPDCGSIDKRKEEYIHFFGDCNDCTKSAYWDNEIRYHHYCMKCSYKFN